MNMKNINSTRLTEYLAAAAMVVSVVLWIGNVSTTATAAAEAVAPLPEKLTKVETKLDERTEQIKVAIEDLKKAQAEQARLILDAIRKK